MTLQATVDLFERHDFLVTLKNNDTHMLLDHRSKRLFMSYWPTTGTWMAWGRTWKNSTPEEVIEAFKIGRLWMPREIQLTVTQCRKCHGTIWWATTTKGKKMCVNADGSNHGRVCKILQTVQANASSAH